MSNGKKMPKNHYFWWASWRPLKKRTGSLIHLVLIRGSGIHIQTSRIRNTRFIYLCVFFRLGSWTRVKDPPSSWRGTISMCSEPRIPSRESVPRHRAYSAPCLVPSPLSHTLFNSEMPRITNVQKKNSDESDRDPCPVIWIILVALFLFQWTHARMYQRKLFCFF